MAELSWAFKRRFLAGLRLGYSLWDVNRKKYCLITVKVYIFDFSNVKVTGFLRLSASNYRWVNVMLLETYVWLSENSCKNVIVWKKDLWKWVKAFHERKKETIKQCVHVFDYFAGKKEVVLL